MKPDQERVRTLLTETITLLCKNGLHYKCQLKVEGLLGVTLDDDEVFIVHLNEVVKEPGGTGAAKEKDPEQLPVSHERSASNSSPPRQSRKRRPFPSRSEIESDSSLLENAPSSKFESSQIEIREEKRTSPRSCQSYGMASSVSVKLEPSDDSVVIIDQNVDPTDRMMSGPEKEPDLSRNCLPSCTSSKNFSRTKFSKRIRQSEPLSSQALISQEHSIEAKAEVLDVGPDFDGSGSSNLGAMPEMNVQPMCNVTFSDGLWTENQQLAEHAASDLQRFSVANMAGLPWTSVQRPNRNSLFPAGSLYHFGPRLAPSQKATAATLPVIVPRRTRYSSEKTYICQYAHCGKTFYQKYNLYRHQREKHGNLFP